MLKELGRGMGIRFEEQAIEVVYAAKEAIPSVGDRLVVWLHLAGETKVVAR